MNEKAIEKIDTFGTSEGFELAQRQAKAMASSDLVPKQYQGHIPNVLIAMELANRIGASVLAIMQHMHIIHGRPSFSSTFLISTVNSSNRFSPIRYRWQGTEGHLSWGCRAYATDKETGEECVGPLVTMRMAKEEGWLDKNGSKWKTMPELMLHYRSAAFWTRVYCPELSMGIHTADEVREMTETDIREGKADVVSGSQMQVLVDTMRQQSTNEDLKKTVEIHTETEDSDTGLEFVYDNGESNE